jgi:hypothetical protein
MPVFDPRSLAGRKLRRTGRVLCLTLLALPLVLLGACAPAPIIDEGYVMVYNDEFDGPTLDPLWQQAPWSTGPEPGIANGSMVLTSDSRGSGYAASTGLRQSQEPNFPDARSWQYGYFEARLRFTDNAWSWPIFWMFSMAKTEAWPQEICPPSGELTSEWNIMEGGLNNGDGSFPASRSVHSVLHRNTRNGSAGPWCDIADATRFDHHVSPDVNLAGWHVWSGLWTEDEVCLYLDNEEIGCEPPYDTTHQPMHIIFSINDHGMCGGCPPRPAQLRMEVDWVRVWQKS